MPKLPYAVVNAFVHDGAGGNGAGVVVEDDLEPAVTAALCGDGRRCAVAAAVGLSETAFVRLAKGTAEDPIHIRYFTPTEEVPLCGHATVATVAHLRSMGKLPDGATAIHIATGAGVLRVALESAAGGRVFLTQSPPDFSRQPLPAAAMAASLGLLGGGDGELDVLVHPTPAAAPVSTGLFDVCVRLRSVEDLVKLTPDFAAMAQVSREHDLCGFHAYVLLESEEERGAFPGADIYARNFGPAVGINEESATGTANGALCSLLWRSGAVKAGERPLLVIAQGDHIEPPAPSRIIVEVLAGTPGEAAPSVGGSAAFVRDGLVELSTLPVPGSERAKVREGGYMTP